MNKAKLPIGIGVAILVACAAYFAFFAQWGKPRGSHGADGGTQNATLIEEKTPSRAATKGTDAARTEKRRRLSKTQSLADAIEADDDMSPEDEKRMEAISDAVDKDDFSALTALIPDIQTSTNAEVRAELVDALGSFGKKSLIELLPFMADPDADVAESARDEWTMALSEVNNSKKKCSYIAAATTVLTDEDALESMMLELTDCDERLAIQTIVDIIATGTKQAVDAAKEQYEFITGDEYTNVADAEAWLQENYEPDEENEE